MSFENEDILSKLIVGRVKPHIYAFSTNTIPNYLKVGDTYRPVAVRLREWMRYFPNLQKQFDDYAIIDDDVFFRDYSVHQYLEKDLSKRRLTSQAYPDLYYSNEFFEDVLVQQVSDAIKDIKENYEHNTGKYKYYDSHSKLPETYVYSSTGEWVPRPNQQETIDRFISAVEAGRKNLLMYAVMRFGKSFTSLCCAKEIGAKTILVVSAKADVREEWKKTVQSADNFNNDYVFVSSYDLLREPKTVSLILSKGKGAVVFLTLQDLQGDDTKEKHIDIFSMEIDLLIVDETHYGARAESYGKVLRTVNYDKDVKDKHADDDFVEIQDAEEQLKELSVKVTLHLSGTPYRILMGSEFSKEDIIAFYQFTDIVRDQEEWDKEHLLNDEEDVKEWDNPYYGFPQMVRFAFIPSKSAKETLESLKSGGTTYAFSALLKPKSINKDNKKSLHKKFVYENEVLELFEAIDGSKEDDGLLSFLDYEKIKEGKMCQHIVCVLPYCASCDALETLINDNHDKFKNLQNYTIINISGVDSPNLYRNIQEVKSKIKKCASEDKKTLTLTVNRMLTGSTVEEWDTMIFLKDTASPQEYDQAIFRLQNQYIKKYVGPDGDIIKYNMKPQTLLVDFDPHRMFVMQELKSQIYNANKDASGNEHLRDRLEEELRISPIITKNKNSIEQVLATDILAAISEYSSNRGVYDETKDLPVDMSLLKFEDIKAEIEKQAELGSRQGLYIEAHEGEENNLDNPDNENTKSDDDSSKDEEKDDSNSSVSGEDKKNDALKVLENKFRTYYSRILFFSYLTKSRVSSLDGIISCLEEEDNARIAKNINLDKKILCLIRKHMYFYILGKLDYKIQNINELAHDEQVEPLRRAEVAITKFDRISDSEVTTPAETASDMIGLIPDECFIEIGKNPNARILDIASTMGEFATAIVKRCKKLGISTTDIRNKILSTPTSSIAYEFTRKVYEVLGLDISSIAEQYNSYDLLSVVDVSKRDYKKACNILSQNKEFNKITLCDECEDLEEEGRMKFIAIVGNPPYHENDGGAGASAKPIYQHYVDISRQIKPEYISLIIPSKWFAGGKGLNTFRKSMLDDIHIKELHDCLHPEEIFPDTNNRGGVCYFLWDKDYSNKSSEKTKVVTHCGNNEIIEVARSMRTRDLDVFIRNSMGLSILDKVIPNEATDVISNHISPRKPFGLDGDFVTSPDFHKDKKGLSNPVKCYGKAKAVGYIEAESVPVHGDWVDCWKVFMPYANNIGTELSDDNQNTFIGEPGSVCTETFLAVGQEDNLTEQQCINLSLYLRTKFARFLLSMAKTSQHGTSKTYRFVPVVDFSQKWTDSKLYAKYGLTQAEIDHIEKEIKVMA